MASPGKSEIPMKGHKSGAVNVDQGAEKFVNALDSVYGENDYQTIMNKGFHTERKEGGKV